MIETIKKLIFISRPISWPNTAYPFAAGYIMSGGDNFATLIVGTFYFLIPYNLLMYGINDVFDYESDIRNPRKGGIEGMREQKEFHPTIIRASCALNIPFIIWLAARGPMLAAIVFLLVLFFVLAYSVAKLRFKERPILDSVTSSLHFSGPLVYALVLNGFKPSYAPYIASFFMWGMASHAFGAVQDIIPDRLGKLASVATVFGAARTVRLSIVLYTAAALALIIQGGLAIMPGVAGLLYVANIYKFKNVTDKDSATTNRAWRRFIWLNMFTGFIVTIVLILYSLPA